MKNQKLLDFLTMYGTDKSFAAGVCAAAYGESEAPDRTLPEESVKARWGFEMAKSIQFVEGQSNVK